MTGFRPCAGESVANSGYEHLALRYSDKTVVFVDVVESVRLIEHDEQRAVQHIRSIVSAIERAVPVHRGRVVEVRGDGCLLEFPDARSACACAHVLHECASELNTGLEPGQAAHLRIGIHRAQVLTDTKTLMGHGVNLASRITTLANVGETVVSAAVAGTLVNGVDGQFEDLGRCHVKHLTQPIHAYRVRPTISAPPLSVPNVSDLKPRVAVMPFVAYRGTPTALGVGDIITDQVICALSKSQSVAVISRLSTSALRGRRLTVEEIAGRLASQYVVSGKHWRGDGRLNVYVEVSRPTTDEVLWSGTVSDTPSAAISVDSNLIRDIAAGVTAAMFAGEVAVVRSTPLPNVASHTLLLAAVNLLYRLSPDDFERAHDALLVLHERAPRHPTPLAWLARWHLFRVVQGWSSDPRVDGELAYSFAHRALDHDDRSSLALTMAGNVETSYRKDLDAAERYYDEALAANPNESLAWLQKGNTRSFKGEGATALSFIEKAVTLSPLDPSRHFYDSLLASAALSAGDYPRAIVAARSSLLMNAHHVSSHRVLAIALALSGQVDEAKRAAAKLLQLEPGLTVSRFVARSPGGASGLAQKFGRALHEAGVPAGQVDNYH